jgi:acetyltransferase-like isoleucine patch superfamily enzyme
MNFEHLPHVSTPARLLNYFWFSLIVRGTGFLPDITPVCLFRGWFMRCCFRACGRRVQIQRGVEIKTTRWVEIGNDVLIAQGCWLNGPVSIGDEVMLGPYVVLAASNHSKLNGSFRFGAPQVKPIRIGRGAWIGAHATITAGVSIGDGAVVGANAVVTRSVPDNAFVAGVPAREISSGLTEATPCSNVAEVSHATAPDEST